MEIIILEKRKCFPIKNDFLLYLNVLRSITTFAPQNNTTQ